MNRATRTGIRLALLALLVAAWVSLLAGPAAADDCSSPADCSNTAWTVAGGAAVAAAIVAAAASQWRRTARNTPECQKLQRYRDRIEAEYNALAAYAGQRQGALKRVDYAKFQARRAVEEMNARVPGSGSAAADAASWAGGWASTAGSSGFAAQAARLGGRAANANALDAAWRTAGLAGSPAGGRGLEQAAAGAGRAGQMVSFGGLLTTIGGHVSAAWRRRALIEQGMLQEIHRMKLAEADRWQSYADELKGKLDAGWDALRARIAQYNAYDARHECGIALDLGELDRFLTDPLGQTEVTDAIAIRDFSFEALTVEPGELPQSLLERARSTSPRPGHRVLCPEYDTHLARYRQELANLPTDRLERYKEETELWLHRRAALDRAEAYVGRLHANVANVLFLDQHSEILLMGSEVAFAVAGIAAVSWWGCALLGLGGIVIGYYRGQTTQPEAKLQMRGVLEARLHFLQSRRAYASAEIARLRSLCLEATEPLVQLRGELVETWSACQEDWASRGEHHEPPPELDPRLAPPSLRDPGEGRYAGIPDLPLIQEISTWR